MHVRSATVVADAVVYQPAAHGALTAWHASALSAGENVEPTLHSWQTRSAIAEPAALTPQPAPHVRHAVHGFVYQVLPALKWPWAQLLQTRSVVGDASVVTYVPGAHGPRTAAHALPSSVAEKVTPGAQSEHLRSVVADGVLAWPLPAGHNVHAAHAWLPGMDFQRPEGQLEHLRFDDAVSGVVSYDPGAHTVKSLHSRSEEPVGALEVYWFAGHESLCVWHLRSDVSVGAFVSNSLGVHFVAVMHASPLSAVEKEIPCTHAWHSRSFSDEGAKDMPEPAGQVFHAAQAVWPALAVNMPSAQSVQVRSVLAVAAALMRWPAGHGARMALQVSVLDVGEKVAPATHAAHVWSAVAEPQPVRP